MLLLTGRNINHSYEQERKIVAINGSKWYDLVADIAIRLDILAPNVHHKIVIFVSKRVRTSGKRERICRGKQHTCSDTSALGHRTVMRDQMW